MRAAKLTCSSGRPQKLDCHAKAGAVVGQLDGGVVQIGDGGDEAKSETAAGRRARALEPIEPPKDILPLGCRYARAIVGQLDGEAVVANVAAEPK
jgi:hypothetical protein